MTDTAPVDIPTELNAAREHVATAFAAAHNANDASGQTSEHLRQLVAQTSAALTALSRAVVHADHASKENET